LMNPTRISPLQAAGMVPVRMAAARRQPDNADVADLIVLR
jgi:hypothetical protein